MTHFQLQSRKLTLPQTGVQVTLRQPTFAEVLELSGAEQQPTKERVASIFALTCKVTSWDALDASGTALPVTEETLGALPPADANLVIEAVIALMNAPANAADGGK